MHLDKIPNSKEFIPTHRSRVLHIQKNPISCIVDPNSDKSQFDLLLDDSTVKAKLLGFLNKDDEHGLLFGFKLFIQSKKQSFEYTIYPDEEFIDTLIFNEIICIISSTMEQYFSFKINTDQFIKTKSEFDKFQKILK